MKLAEGLALRKQLVQRIERLEPLKIQAEQGYFKETVTRIRVTDPIPGSTDEKIAAGTDEVTKKEPLLTPESIFKEFDRLATSLRKLDAAIQQANWTVDLGSYTAPEGMQ